MSNKITSLIIYVITYYLYQGYSISLGWELPGLYKNDFGQGVIYIVSYPISDQKKSSVFLQIGSAIKSEIR